MISIDLTVYRNIHRLKTLAPSGFRHIQNDKEHLFLRRKKRDVWSQDSYGEQQPLYSKLGAPSARQARMDSAFADDNEDQWVMVAQWTRLGGGLTQ